MTTALPADAVTAPPVDLACVTVALAIDGAPRLTGTVFDGPGYGFVGHGEAARLRVPAGPDRAAEAVAGALGAIGTDDRVQRPGTGPVAFGALPFATPAGGELELVVPRTVLGRGPDGARWLTTIAPRHEIGAASENPPAWFVGGLGPAGSEARPEPTTFTVASERPVEEWCEAVAAVRDDLRAGRARKAVLARAVTVLADQPFSRDAILERLRSTYPACMLFAVDGFVGASPELLVSRMGDTVRCHPMAGTTPRSADPATDARLAAALRASAKDQIEHRITIDMVHETLLPWCSYLDEEAEPSVVAMANVQHLATMMEGRLSAPPASVLQLALALHPTPAVGGYPRAEALQLIERYEQLDRGRYAGPVGWVDAAGNGEWAVGIRSAEIDGPRARLFAGVGVVPDSDPAAELAETRAKLQAVLTAVVRP